MNGTPGGQTATVVSPNLVRQTGNGLELSESVVTPGASNWEANIYPNTLNRLNSGAPYNLDGVLTAGPGDATWAYQWDTTIDPGATFIISKDKRLSPTPEPSTLAIAGLAALGMIGYGMRRSRRA
jgi:hypothetical protein